MRSARNKQGCEEGGAAGWQHRCCLCSFSCFFFSLGVMISGRTSTTRSGYGCEWLSRRAEASRPSATHSQSKWARPIVICITRLQEANDGREEHKSNQQQHSSCEWRLICSLGAALKRARQAQTATTGLVGR